MRVLAVLGVLVGQERASWCRTPRRQPPGRELSSVLVALSRPEIDLASIAAAQPRLDHSLKALVMLARIGGMPVSFLAGGYLVTGILAPSIAWGEHVDEAIREGLPDDLEGELVSAGWPEAIVEQLVGAFRVSFAEQERDRERRDTEHFAKMQELREDVEPALTDLPEDLAREEIIGRHAHHASITLRDTRVYGGGLPADGLDVGMMRVMTAHIAGWWPGTHARV